MSKKVENIEFSNGIKCDPSILERFKRKDKNQEKHLILPNSILKNSKYRVVASSKKTPNEKDTNLQVQKKINLQSSPIPQNHIIFTTKQISNQQQKNLKEFSVSKKDKNLASKKPSQKNKKYKESKVSIQKKITRSRLPIIYNFHINETVLVKPTNKLGTILNIDISKGYLLKVKGEILNWMSFSKANASLIKVPAIEEKSINPRDFLIKVHNFHCSKEAHSLISIKARIFLYSKDKKYIETILVPAGYCETCRYYYILSTDYREFLEGRTTLNDIVQEEGLDRYLSKHAFSSKTLSDRSLMRKCGYSVAETTNLSDTERLEILYWIMKNKILSREEIKSFINWLIHFRSSEPNLNKAIAKWKMDYEAIRYPDNSIVVDAKRIRIHR